MVGLFILFLRVSRVRVLRDRHQDFIEFFQGTPLLMQLFLFFFGLALFGIEVSPWLAAGLALTLWTAPSSPRSGAAASRPSPRASGRPRPASRMSFIEQMRYVILPQALRIAIAPTVGFSVQVVKGTALASIIGFVELTKAGTMLTNATFQPFLVYSMVALIYFCLCFPLSWFANASKGSLDVAR